MISASAELVRVNIYRGFAATGRCPTPDDLAVSTGLSTLGIESVLAELDDSHHIVRRDGEVVLAHPFATRSFGFSVMGPHTLWWGGCAWDSFAIPHLVPDAPEVLVATTCPACASPHAFTVTNREPPVGTQVAHFLVPVVHIWDDVVHSCANQLIFCSEECVDVWLERTGHQRGSVLSLATLWALASHWYDGRLDSPYSRREPSEAASYFRSVGLTGPFWEASPPA